jgi:hypothetical protein
VIVIACRFLAPLFVDISCVFLYLVDGPVSASQFCEMEKKYGALIEDAVYLVRRTAEEDPQNTA